MDLDFPPLDPVQVRIRESLASMPEIPRLADLEIAAINLALARSAGNRTHAAKALGVSVRTLQRKIRRPGPIDSLGVSGQRSTAEMDRRRSRPLAALPQELRQKGDVKVVKIRTKVLFTRKSLDALSDP